jgi:hypothetical protein
MTDSVPTVAEFTALLEELVPDTDQLSQSELEALHLWKAEELGGKLMHKSRFDTSKLDAKALRKHNLLTAWAIVGDTACATVPKTSTPSAFEDPEPESSGCSARSDDVPGTSGENSASKEALAQEGSGLVESSRALTKNTDKLDNA